ncbi:MAG: hypothetical protein ABIH03_01670 [Pseudomonadota bacterium]
MADVVYQREDGKQFAIKAGLIGIGLALTALPLTGAVSYHFGWSALVPITSSSALLGGGILVTAVYKLRTQTELERQIYQHEEETGEDIDGDGVVGDPSDPANIVYVHRGDNKTDVPEADKADFRHFIENGLWGEWGATWREWDGRDLPSGRKMERAMWESFSDRLLAAQVARKHDNRPNATLIRRATLEQAIATFEQAGLI